MAPPGNSVDLKAAKKGKKSNSKEERKHRKDKHERPAADDEAPPRNESKRKHKDGQEGKEHGKKPKKDKKAAADTEATGEGEAKRGHDKMKRAMEDERFAAARTDPRFRPMRRKEAKVALDSRFDGMLTNPMFASSEAPVDKRGRRRKKSARENPMLHYYLNQEEGDEKEKESKEKQKLIRVEEEEDDEQDEEENEQDEEESSNSDDDEDEDEDEEDDDQYSVGSDIAHYLMARHDDTPMTDKETHRLAVVNMDWDHIKAVDLYMVMTSCVPKGGRVLSVSIYPSEFGLECMNIETTQGPSALVGADKDEDEDVDEDDSGKDDNDDSEDDDSDDVDGEEDSEHDSETENNRLRAYELNRLRYYYAVVECDSSATANHLYTTLDGTEFLKTANVFDLQFVPDSREFKHAARDVATEAPPSYKEPDFETRALQHSKVRPTWDDDAPDRKKMLRRKFKEDDQFDDIAMFLASDSSDDDADDSGDDSAPKRKLTIEEKKALLLQGDESDEEETGDQDMEITFNTELEDLSKRILERKSTEKTKTVWETHQEKMKEKRKARKRSSKDDDDDDDSSDDEDSADEKDDFFEDEKSDDEEVEPIKKQEVTAKGKRQRTEKREVKKAQGKGKIAGRPEDEHFEPEATKEELELLVAADQDAANGAKGYNIKRKSKKGKKGKDSVEEKVPEIDLSADPRFSQMFTSHLYAVDPTDPQYKRSATFVRKQGGKKGARAGTLDSEPPVEESPLGNPDDAPKNASRKRDGASTEKLQMLSAVNSLKRNLTAFKKAGKSER